MSKQNSSLNVLIECRTLWSRFSNFWNLPDIVISPLYMSLIATVPPHSSWLHKLKILGSGLRKRWQSVPVCDLPKDKVSVVFWPTENNHVDQMLPVADALAAKGISFLFVVNKKKILPLLRSDKYPYFFLSGNLQGSYSIQVILEKELAAFKESLTVGDVRFEKVVKELRSFVSSVSSLILFTQELVSRVQPEVFVVGYDITIEGRAATYVCKSKGVRTCCIQHGDMSGMLNSQHVVDEFYVYGGAVKEQLDQINESAITRFSATGAPYLDTIDLQGNKRVRKIPALLGRSVTRPYILVAFSGPGNNTSHVHHRLLIKSIFELNQQMPDITIVVKLHPKDKEEYYAEFYSDYPSHNLVVIKEVEGCQGLTIFDWLSGSDILITGGSTTALEAMLLNIPVISIDAMNEFGAVNFVANKACIGVQNDRQLVETVKGLLGNKDAFRLEKDRMRSYVEEYFYRPPQGAAQLCAEKIQKTITLRT